MILAVILFLITYVLMIGLPNYRAYVALGSAFIFVILGILPVTQVFEYIDFNVLMMIAGTMGIVYYFIESKMPDLMADLILEKMPNVKWAIVALSLFAGIISAFVDNVATVLMIAPVDIEISKKLKISPVKSIIAIAVASNLQGAATLVGDTTSIGASANITALGILRKEGHQVKASTFMKIGVPFTMAAVITGYVLVWLLFR